METNVTILKAKAQEILDQAKAVKEQMGNIGDWDTLGEVIKNITTIGDFILNVVLAVEVAANDAMNDVEDLKSEDKVEAAAQLLDDAFELKWYLEIVDKAVFQLVLSSFVYFLNKQYGSDWNLDKMRESLSSGVNFIKMMTSLGTSAIGNVTEEPNTES